MRIERLFVACLFFPAVSHKNKMKQNLSVVHKWLKMRHFASVACVGCISAPRLAAEPPSLRLPSTVPPVIGAWFPQDRELQVEDGYREYLDAAIAHGTFNIVTTSIRAPNRSMLEPAVHDWFKRAATYAKERGIGIALELDVRHSIPDFKKRYPDDLQQRLWLTEIDITGTGTVATQVAYNGNNGDAITAAAATGLRLERVYSYVRKGSAPIEADSVRDITAACTAGNATRNTLDVTLPRDASNPNRKACILTTVTFDYPSVFSPHLLSFEAETVRQYADVPLAGAMKDEWGFPADHEGNPNKNAFWFSRDQAKAYAAASGGREPVRDSLLMWLGESGREGERQAAINHTMELSRARNTEIEQAYYHLVKKTFGKAAFVGTHDTVFPYPDAREFERNGLNWWTATRDFAQTDEITPYSCRTSLSKKFGGLWYNQWYDSNVSSYSKGIWSYALAGGRMNFHVFWPAEGNYADLGKNLLRSQILRADSRIRLLNLITKAPLDCPIGVIFSQPNAMNWAGTNYQDVGTELTDALWKEGFYADLIPTSEIGSPALRMAADGAIWYGRQRYAAVILYQPQFERPSTGKFFSKPVANPNNATALYRIGDWTRDFNGKQYDGNATLPKRMLTSANIEECAAAVIADLTRRGHVPQTRATITLPKWNNLGKTSAALPSAGKTRLTDGTVVVVAGEENTIGDHINQTFKVNSQNVTIDAEGIVAIRLGTDGKVEAFAAGGLKSVSAPGLKISLPERADLALWRDSKRVWHGALQTDTAPIPAPLTKITKDWLRLAIPTPLP